MACFTFLVDHFRHIEGIKIAFHDKLQLMLGWVIKFNVECCYESIEYRAGDNN